MRALCSCLLTMLAAASLAQAIRNDVVIDEIMADPSPGFVGGLPELEYLELKNVSSRSFDLHGWKLQHGTGAATVRDHIILHPDSFVILCPSGSREALAVYGTALSVPAFPSLDNNGEELVLISDEGIVIHAVHYRKSWYRNALKAEGGWSLEMIDPANACGTASNWTASPGSSGGTPGRTNAAHAANPDAMPPAIVNGYCRDSLHIVLLFDEPLDSASCSDPSKYIISGDMGPPVAVLVPGNIPDMVVLRTKVPLENDKVYTITVKEIADCSGNLIGGMNTVHVGRASEASPGEIVVNEILFNPNPGGVDYTELYNRGKHIVDLKELFIANRDNAGTIGTARSIAATSLLLLPGAYYVVTENAAAVRQQYHTRDAAAFGEPVIMPTFPDDAGTVVLLNSNGVIIDEVSYSEDWHFALIENRRGVALERIDYSQPGSLAANWHSAATAAGYGTPGYQNSQTLGVIPGGGAISISPKLFSPDNDGFDDYATIRYEFPEPGYVCNVTLFDGSGRTVRLLARNSLCGMQGSFVWDGLDDRKQFPGIGVYIVITEVFHLTGKIKKYKHAIILARKLR